MDAPQHIENFLQFLTTGILTGVIYGLMCVGLTTIFGIMRVINFAQGEFMMVGMYVAYYCFGFLGVHLMFGEYIAPFISALAAAPVVYLLGIALHKLLVSRVTGVRSTTLESEGHYAQLILTLGISLILSNGGLVVFGSVPVSISTPLAWTAWSIGPLSGDRIVVFVNQKETIAAVLAIAIVVGFAAFMSRTRLGRSLRAAADNATAAIYMGIDVGRAHRIAFGLGVALTAIGGGLLASGTAFQPFVGIEYVIVMYAGVVLGGLGSLWGAFFGGLTIGLIRAMSALFLPYQLENTAIFVCFLAILLLRPDGLFGRATRRA
jgi:branched-chain amino acid transport system permease protein